MQPDLVIFNTSQWCYYYSITSTGFLWFLSQNWWCDRWRCSTCKGSFCCLHTTVFCHQSWNRWASWCCTTFFLWYKWRCFYYSASFCCLFYNTHHVVVTAIYNLANKYREEFKMPNLKISYNNRQGFYFSIPKKDTSGELPDKFIQVHFMHLL